MKDLPSVDTTVKTSARLVLYEGEQGPEGSLFSLDATAYSHPLFHFSLQADQELPRIAPGGVVEVIGVLERKGRPIIRAGDVEIVPQGGLRSGGEQWMRVFAERGSTIGHPAVIGWNENWRYVRPSSLLTVDEWERRLSRYIREGRIYAGLLLALVAFLVISEFVWDRSGPIYPFTAASGGALVLRWRIAIRARRALAAARLSTRGAWTPMQMRLWWSAGHGHGPMAVASLFPPNAGATAANATAHIPLSNVPPGFAPDGLLDVTVAGDPSKALVVRYEDLELWPADRPYKRLGGPIRRQRPRS
jgi:hypothetical protein